tara:strand:+ start:3514 stop:4914 length:1401 start_codon:yes stop_codon:yes gene_type:complete
MPYTPRTSREILRDLRGMILGRTELNDILTGSVLNTLLSSFAQQLASSERRLFNIRESFFLNGAIGSDLDERVNELPPVGISRIQRTNASASALTITRTGLTGDLLIPAGSIVAKSNGVQYRTVSDVIIPNGDIEVSNVQIIALVSGTNGNALIGEINTVVSMPSDISSVSNTQVLTNGTNEESDEELRRRALTYLQSLSRCSASTLEFLALSFVSSAGDRMKFASIFEDLERPAYSELVVDDGSGLNVESISKAGQTIQGTVPVSNSRILYHEKPATEPLTTANIQVLRGGSSVTLLESDITSVHERGVVYIKEGVLQAGDTWTISNYRVFEGFVKELQDEIEGDVSNPVVLTGFRASGTRVVVTLADSQFISFDLTLQTELDFNFELVEYNLKETLQLYINSLAPSEPLYVSALVETSKGVDGVLDVVFYKKDSTDRLENIYTRTPRSAIRIQTGSITVTNVPA